MKGYDENSPGQKPPGEKKSFGEKLAGITMVPAFGLAGMALLLIALSGAIACNRGPATRGQEGRPAGAIRVSGAWALYPMMVRWGEEFHKVNPGVRVDVSAGGAGKGVTDTLAGLVDIGMASRDSRQEELNKGAVFLPVARDAVFPTVCARNPVATELLKKGLTKNTLKKLFLDGTTMTWGQVAGTAKTAKIQVYTRSDSCGAAETWAKYLGATQSDLRGTAVYGDPGLAQAVRQDPLGIGYNNLGFAYDPAGGRPMEGLLVVPIDVNENGQIDPAEDISTKEKALRSIVVGVYPSPPARNLYLVVKKGRRGLATEFIRWILTDGQKYVDEVGFIRLPGETVKDTFEKINE